MSSIDFQSHPSASRLGIGLALCLSWGSINVHAEPPEPEAPASPEAAPEAVPEEESEVEPNPVGSMEGIRHILLFGEEADGPWTGSSHGEDDQSYQLSNTEVEEAVKTYRLHMPESTYGTRTVGITVEQVTDGKAGLIYGYNDGTYYAMVVDEDRKFHLFERNEDGFRLKMTTDLDGDWPVTLAVTEDGRRIDVILNGVNHFGLENSRTGHGDVGIMAMHTGEFVFRDFVLEYEQEL